MRVWVVAGLVLAMQSASVMADSKARIVCWTNEQGQRACGDHLPPQYAAGESRVYDDSGRVIETREREKTEAELAAEQRLAALRAEQQKRDEERAAYDRFLLQTYARPDDIARARDERVAMIDGRVRLTLKAIADGEASLRKMQDRREKAGDKAAQVLLDNIAKVDASLQESRAAVERLAAERQRICTEFGGDITRFSRLKGESESSLAGCPSPDWDPEPMVPAAEQTQVKPQE